MNATGCVSECECEWCWRGVSERGGCGGMSRYTKNAVQ